MPLQSPETQRCKLWTRSNLFFRKVCNGGFSPPLCMRVSDSFHPHTMFTKGDVGKEFYFVLQGSVAIKLNNRIIKVCRPLLTRAYLFASPRAISWWPLTRFLARKVLSEKFPSSANANALQRCDRVVIFIFVDWCDHLPSLNGLMMMMCCHKIIYDDVLS